MKNKFLSLLMAMIMVIGMGGNLVSYADDSLKIYPSSIYESEGKEFATLTVTVQNHTDQPMSGVVVSISNDDKIPNPGTLNNSKTVSVPAKKDGKPGEAAVTWEVNLIGIPMGTVHFLTAKAVSNGNNASERFSITVNPKSDGDIGKANLPDMTPKDYTYKPDPTVNYNPQVKLQVIAPSGGINGGATNSVQLKIQNTGNAPFNQVTAGITTLGDKMTLQNSPTEQQLGAMARNGEKTVSFPIHVEGSHPGGNVPIGFTVKVLDPTGKETSFSITEYVTVNSGTSLADRLEIVNISNPSTVVPNQDFTLTFAVRNNSSSVAKNVKITVEPTAPVVNKTKNIFVENLAGGSSKAFNIKMFAPINAETQAQNYPIKITAETTGPDAASIVQYSGVFVNSGNEKTVPQLIITHYTYGGEAAVANEVFPLSMVIKNTNTNQTIKNIKVSLLAEEGVFIPHNASSSFYIASIGPGGSATKTVEMMTKPDAPEKTVAINVDMTYEDKNGSQVTAKDIISVPVVQMRRIVVDDVVATEPLFVGQQANISVQYYNMGKSTLSNLIISAEGDFTFPQSTKVFVGKFDPGKNDFYDLQLIPNNVGEASGKLIFSFEDSNGKQITMEKPFKLTAEEAIPVEPPMEEIPENGNGKKPWIYGIGGGLAAAVIGTLIYKKRKKKMNDSLDMDNDNE